ncbi:methionine synthase (B12-independent) [Arcicella aurantiaca]|uniref:5-methyltetrahydropteroyltriglutamate--homocysteine methyltransferase n=1 Tax=Arcicella aurantiaca TaxID=591202 RepID=A0A316E0C4_9BACT|nr:5-methyltetrahydropteroyltriglutamate--homocysteine S-methyltransferase [Arcicella aurantiaca]PWK23894.1 methionine synthase (B12-independent) [Arcicella aurantiaca]
MITHNLGYPRIGSQRELKRASEQFWAGKISVEELQVTALKIRQQNWQTQQEAGIDLIPSNDFSFYDHVLDMSLMLGVIPTRYKELEQKGFADELTTYFAMARGYQQNEISISAMEMTKWFDTNYHYIVPEFTKNQTFSRFSNKAILDFEEAKALGIITKPVLVGPVTFLLLGKEKENGFERIDLLENLLPVYIDILKDLESKGAVWVQLDEPSLTSDLSENEQIAFQQAYQTIRESLTSLKIMVATYFECTGENIHVATSLPIDALHLDLVRCPSQLGDILELPHFVQSEKLLSLGIIDGRNIWKNDFSKSLAFIKRASEILSEDRLLIAPSCSLLHSPCDLDLEKNEDVLTPEIKKWMAFAKQKLNEVATLKALSKGEYSLFHSLQYTENQEAIASRTKSELIHKPHVKKRVNAITKEDSQRKNPFEVRQALQLEALKLPIFPTTTIGSFPQTDEVRTLRAKLKKGVLSEAEYENLIEKEIEKSIHWQEEIGLDVLVHGEFERNDMVEYFGEQLSGYVFTQNGWVQSYGSRCVKPPIIYGDVERPTPMTVKWSSFAQSKTNKLMKGMLTGPITILQWSFVRDDQPRRTTAFQIALAIRDEVLDLEKAGIKVIQIDEPAIREGLPLRRADWENYLEWAVEAFRLSASKVQDITQIHTHMCYSEFNDIIRHIAAMDADVITIETSRSQMELLDAFVEFEYPNEIGPGVYDIHSPRVPESDEMLQLLEKALVHIPARNLWVNPDCGLKTRKWAETEAALKNMIIATQKLRESVLITG